MPTVGLVFWSASDRARRSQRMVLELLLSDMPEAPYRQDSELHLWAAELSVSAGRLPQRSLPSALSAQKLPRRPI
jgi:formate dehydrogenase major subunit